MRVLFAGLLLISFSANAWMEPWAPAFKSVPADVRALPPKSVSNFVGSVGFESRAEYSQGGALDLNGDGVDDYVIIIPWMGCGLNANGYDVHFIVSDGVGGRMKTVMQGYGIEMSDLVNVAGKPYFRHSEFFCEFERSKHNHWVYQMFSFGTNGAMRCANAEVGRPFPAATIYYTNPKFRQIELTAADLREIEEETCPVSCKYNP